MTAMLLVVDDDEPFRLSLSRAMARRGFTVHAAASLYEAIHLAGTVALTHAAIDLRLDDGNGLDLVGHLRQAFPGIRMVLLTGYGNIASAVSAIKAGAVDYLPKPVEADRLAAILLGVALPAAEGEDAPMTAERVRWEHIQRVLDENGQNVSETARRLKMHRRTLQRILGKHAPK